jgi:hypothetical protein
MFSRLSGNTEESDCYLYNVTFLKSSQIDVVIALNLKL